MDEHYERAALFQPFDSLKGFRSQLKQQERVIVERPQLFEEELQMLDQKLQRLRPGMLVTVCYIENGDCLRLQGMVAAVHRDARQLQIVKTRIPFDAIVDLSGEALDEDPFAIP